MWIYRTRVELQDAEDEDSPPPPNSPPSPSVSHEPPIRPSRRSSSPTRWTRRKKDLKLNPSSSRRSLQTSMDAAHNPAIRVLDMYESIMQSRMESCQRINRLIRNANRTHVSRVPKYVFVTLFDGRYVLTLLIGVHTTQNVVPQITRVMSINSVAGRFLPFTCIIVIFLASTSSHIVSASHCSVGFGSLVLVCIPIARLHCSLASATVKFKSLSLRHTRVIIPTYCFFLSAVTWARHLIIHTTYRCPLFIACSTTFVFFMY